MNVAGFVERQGRAVVLITLLLAGAGALVLPTLPSDIYPPLQFPRLLVIAHSGSLPARSMMTSRDPAARAGGHGGAGHPPRALADLPRRHRDLGPVRAGHRHRPRPAAAPEPRGRGAPGPAGGDHALCRSSHGLRLPHAEPQPDGRPLRPRSPRLRLLRRPSGPGPGPRRRAGRGLGHGHAGDRGGDRSRPPARRRADGRGRDHCPARRQPSGARGALRRGRPAAPGACLGALGLRRRDRPHPRGRAQWRHRAGGRRGRRLPRALPTARPSSPATAATPR